jgi:homeobox-leucine zipper protein
MSAKFHLPSPVIPTRECVFARYSKQFSHNLWAVVDVSLEDILQSPSNNFHKKPSGCLIEGMPDGNSKVRCIDILLLILIINKKKMEYNSSLL